MIRGNVLPPEQRRDLTIPAGKAKVETGWLSTGWHGRANAPVLLDRGKSCEDVAEFLRTRYSEFERTGVKGGSDFKGGRQHRPMERGADGATEGVGHRDPQRPDQAAEPPGLGAPRSIRSMACARSAAGRQRSSSPSNRPAAANASISTAPSPCRPASRSCTRRCGRSMSSSTTPAITTPSQCGNGLIGRGGASFFTSSPHIARISTRSGDYGARCRPSPTTDATRHGGFCQAVFGFLRDDVPDQWHALRDAVTDNFRVINPTKFQVVA
jgi:hypothetical protein